MKKTVPRQKQNKSPAPSDIEALERKVEEVKRKHSKPPPPPKPANPTRISIELLAGVVVGAGIGYLIDHWLGTLPLFFLICFFLGVAGSGLNIYKITQQFTDDENHEGK